MLNGKFWFWASAIVGGLNLYMFIFWPHPWIGNLIFGVLNFAVAALLWWILRLEADVSSRGRR